MKVARILLVVFLFVACKDEIGVDRDALDAEAYANGARYFLSVGVPNEIYARDFKGYAKSYEVSAGGTIAIELINGDQKVIASGKATRIIDARIVKGKMK